ncbi:hypothetical protein Pth03_04640 [Planotetraspora thailandica]|uniref:SseB protein N-terminal domain-containing protein n=1 Tax=Planotetraspora thailandica TaxID=487172 RepID=A0A8J3UWP1_9ACTN|nr:hypothetical protein Pth03_04640 [Planotetraspora thailandica]
MHDDDTLLEFFALLLDGTVFVLARPGQQGEPPIALLMLGSEDGDFMPCFTSWAKTRDTRAALPDVAAAYEVGEVETRAFLGSTWGRGVVLNPHSPDSLTFEPGMVDRLIDAVDDTVTVLRTGDVTLPGEILTELARRLDATPGVLSAHVGWIYYPPGPQQLTMVVLARDPGSVDTTPYRLPGGEEIHILTPATAEGNLLSSVPPFYVRA